MHPDVARLVKKYGRWHHQVDYGPFRGMRLVRRPGLDLSKGVDEYGMRLMSVGDG
jgi:hypothetical protein